MINIWDIIIPKNITYKGKSLIRKHKIKTQLDGLKTENKDDIKSKIISYFSDRISYCIDMMSDFYIKNWDDIVNIFNEKTKIYDKKNGVYKYNNNYKKENDKLNIKLLKIYNLYTSVEMSEYKNFEDYFFDMYTLARMFRNFGEKDSIRKIVYAGQWHINNMVDFLKTQLNIEFDSFGTSEIVRGRNPIRCFEVDFSKY